MEISESAIESAVQALQNMVTNWQRTVNNPLLSLNLSFQYLIRHMNQRMVAKQKQILMNSDTDNSMIFEAQTVQVAIVFYFCFPCQVFFDFKAPTKKSIEE